MIELHLDLIQSLAASGLALFLGTAVVRALPALRRSNVPTAVVGGLLVASLVTVARAAGLATVRFDTSLNTPLMTAFFTSIGLSASLSLLRTGTGQALLFLALASILAVVQNLIGVGVAVACGETPLLGVLMGSAALTGGPATAMAFEPQFTAAGVPGAKSLAIAAAMSGIVLGGLLGGPVATGLLRRRGLADPRLRAARIAAAAAPPEPSPEPWRTAYEPDAGPSGDDEEGSWGALVALTVLLVSMAAGGILSAGFVRAGLTLPGYVGAMLAGAIVRNLDDATGWIRIPHDLAARIGAVCLTLFLSSALMDLRLWELASLALPLAINVAVQAAAVALYCRWPVFPAMGSDYDAGVMAGGFTGFMLGTTANAMAVMHTLVERFGPAPRAFLVAPIVGAFFIDFTNALIITAFLALFG